MLGQLFLQSAGAGVGVFVGCLIGLGLRRRQGKTEGLMAGSVVLTSVMAGGLALLVMMTVNYLTKGA